MSRLTDLRQRLLDYEAAGATAGSLQDISAMRMQEIRKKFDENRMFYEEIRALYALVRAGARQEAAAAVTPVKAPARTRVLYVAITSNRHFLGLLVHDIITAFVAALTKEPEATGIVIGSTGWQYYEQLGVPARSRSLALAGDMPTPEEYRVLHEQFAGFDRILVIYPRFVNPFQQEVTTLDITQSPVTEPVAPKAPGESVESYIFEPEVPSILAFFDAQVRWVLLGRVMLEAELARTAARLMRMGDAKDRVEKLVKDVQGDVRQEVAVLSNMELLETFAGFATWHKK